MVGELFQFRRVKRVGTRDRSRGRGPTSIIMNPNNHNLNINHDRSNLGVVKLNFAFGGFARLDGHEVVDDAGNVDEVLETTLGSGRLPVLVRLVVASRAEETLIGWEWKRNSAWFTG